MAEEQAEQPKPSGKSLVSKLIVWLGIPVAAAVVALLTFQFVLRPILGSEEKETDAEADTDKIPPGRELVDLENGIVQVTMPPGSDLPASILLYQVSIECNNLVTRQLVEANRPRFVDMIRKLHSNRQREELDDPMLLESIQRRAVEESNKILQRLQPEPNPDVKVTGVFHLQFLVDDKL